MADSKITALTSISTSTDPANDPLVIVDVSDTSMAATGTTKKVTLNNLLACSPTATLASATITGDLTVDTSTLKVDSANNRVGIGTATPNRNLTLFAGASPVLQLCDSTSGTTANDGLLIQQVGVDTYLENAEIGSMFFRTSATTRYSIDSTGVSTWSVGGTTAMTLNSTGLGVGNSSPAAALDLTNTGITASREIRIENSAVRTFLGVEGSSGRFVGSAANNAYFGCSGAFGLEFATNNNVRMVVDTSGNVGIGVTPSAGKGCLQLSSGINFPATQVASSDANTLDDYVEGTFTPVIQGVSTAGTGTYTVQAGRYTKIGNRVFVDIFLNWTAHTGTGAMLIANLPFTIKNTSNYYPSVTFGQLNNIALAANSVLTGYGTFNTKTLNLDQYPVGGGATSSVQMDPSASIVCSVCYEV